MDERSIRLGRLQEYLASDPNNIHLLGDTVDLLLQVGLQEEAETLLTRALALAPNNGRSLHQQALLRMTQSRFGEAAELLQALNENGFQQTGILYNLALCHAIEGKFELALPLLTSIHQSQERFLEADVLYLRALHHIGDVGKALPIARILVEGNPEHADLLGILALLLLDSQEAEEAFPYAKHAHSLKPDCLEALSVLGSQALEEFEVETARQYFEHALKVQPNDGRSWMGCGLAGLLEKDLDLGEACLEKAVGYMPGHLGSWNTLAWIRVMKNDIAGAESAIEVALEQDRTFSESHGMLAVIQILQGHRETGAESAKRALKLDPRCFSAQFAQILLLDSGTEGDRIQRRTKALFSTPISESGLSIEKQLHRYYRKLK